MAAKWKAEAKAKYATFAGLAKAKAKALGGPPVKAKAPIPGIIGPIAGELFANLSARVDGGMTTMTAGDYTQSFIVVAYLSVNGNHRFRQTSPSGWQATMDHEY